jgi:hypothetical protein
MSHIVAGLNLTLGFKYEENWDTCQMQEIIESSDFVLQ